MRLSIQPSDPTPIYRQIADQVRRLVAGGHVAAGTELPGVRQLAQEHAINPMTVSKAYGLLEAEGVLERRRGLAMVVAPLRTPARAVRQRERERLALLAPTLRAAAQQAHQLGLPAEAALALFERALREERSAQAATAPSAESP
jgi:GntR family transcriptional regulator